jgi:hypothetical protein
VACDAYVNAAARIHLIFANLKRLKKGHQEGIYICQFYSASVAVKLNGENPSSYN